MTVGTLFYNLHFKSSFLTPENIKFLKVFMKKKSFLLQSATQHPFFWDNSYLKLVKLFFIIEIGVDSYCSPSDQHTQTTCCTTKNSHFHFPLPNLLFKKKKKRQKEIREDINLLPIRYQSQPGDLLASRRRAEVSVWQHAWLSKAGRLVAVTQCPERDILLGLGQRWLVLRDYPLACCFVCLTLAWMEGTRANTLVFS